MDIGLSNKMVASVVQNWRAAVLVRSAVVNKNAAMYKRMGKGTDSQLISHRNVSWTLIRKSDGRFFTNAVQKRTG